MGAMKCNLRLHHAISDCTLQFQTVPIWNCTMLSQIAPCNFRLQKSKKSTISKCTMQSQIAPCHLRLQQSEIAPCNLRLHHAISDCISLLPSNCSHLRFSQQVCHDNDKPQGPGRTLPRPKCWGPSTGPMGPLKEYLKYVSSEFDALC